MPKNNLSKDLEAFISLYSNYFETGNFNPLITILFKVPTNSRLKYLENHYKNKYNQKIKNLELGKEILSLTSFIKDSKTLYSESLYCIYHNLLEVPRCKYCGEPCKYLGSKKGYSDICKNQKCSSRHRIDTNIERYGVDIVTKNEKISKKISSTWKSKSIEEIELRSKKIQETKRKNQDTEKIKEKTKYSNLLKYGVEWSAQSTVSKENRKAHFIEKFGVENPFQIPEVIDKIKQKNKEANFKKAKSYVEETGKYILLEIIPDETGVYSRGLYKIKCLKCGDIFLIPRGKVKHLKDNNNGELCLQCFPKNIKSSMESIGEIELKQMIKSLGISYHSREFFRCKKEERNLYGGKKGFEGDIVINDLNLIIEYNGNYWHSTKEIKDSSYHQNKRAFFNSLGYDVIFIWEDDFLYRKNLVLDFIKSKISNYKIKITNKKIISSKEAELFTREKTLEYRLSDYSNCYGLFALDELVGIITKNKMLILSADKHNNISNLKDFLESGIYYNADFGKLPNMEIKNTMLFKKYGYLKKLKEKFEVKKHSKDFLYFYNSGFYSI